MVQKFNRLGKICPSAKIFRFVKLAVRSQQKS